MSELYKTGDPTMREQESSIDREDVDIRRDNEWVATCTQLPGVDWISDQHRCLQNMCLFL